MFSRSFTSSLAILIVIVAAMVLETESQQKISSCCTKVSTKKIDVPILGYSIQKWNPPCVKAVIFQTEKGQICSHWKEQWVFEKVKELERVRRLQATTATVLSEVAKSTK